jgi:hypothetical protein
MPQRGIDTGIWSHVDFCGLTPNEKLLFLYLVTTFRGNQAGLYRITERQIAFDTGLDEAVIADMLPRLSVMDIDWMPETQTVWVKRFVHHQCHAPKFLIAVAKNLEDMRRSPELVRAYLRFNDSLSIPYREPADNVSISESDQIRSESVSGSVSEAPTGTTLDDMNLLEDEVANLQSWGAFGMDDRAWLESTTKDYPSVLPADIRDMGAWWYAKAEKDHKVKHSKAQWKTRLRNWLRHKVEGGKDGQVRGSPRAIPGNAPSGAFSRFEAQFENRDGDVH